MTAAYPLEEFSNNYQKNAPESWEPTGVIAAIGKCNSEMDAELLKRGLKPRAIE